MRFVLPFHSAVAAGVFASAVVCLLAQEPKPAEQTAAEQPKETAAKGMPPRVAPTEYQAHAQAGMVTIGAEFMGHSVTTPDHTYSSEDYIVVEAGLFGPADTHIRLTRDDFTLRIAGRKMPLASEPYELVFHSLKDPEWQPPESKEDKQSATSFNAGGAGNGDKLPPLPPKMPFPLRRAMEQQVQRSAMQEGDRPLPQAGLLFFQYRGKPDTIRSLELVYSGAAGKATIELQP